MLPETAQAFLACGEHSLNQLAQTDVSEATYSQRRAGAAIRKAEASLQEAGGDTATADRYQVIVSVDAAEFAKRETMAFETAASVAQPSSNKVGTQSRRATVNAANPIARETARRIACDCSITTHTKVHEGGYCIQEINGNEHRLTELLVQ